MTQVDYFVEQVRYFLTLTDQVEMLSPYKYLASCAITLPKIYAFGLLLPDVELTETVEDTLHPLPHRASINLSLDKYRFYRQIYDPVTDEDVVMGDIIDDLADIYQDLSQPLKKFETLQSNTQRVAIWEWKFNIKGHCGDHIVNVLRPIHVLINYHLADDDTLGKGLI